tara:strand:+ start:1692 stop:2324 length:633 start_codon:yes stop_codon:yes gene_type:complete
MPGGYGTDESLPWGSSGDSYTTVEKPTFDVGDYDIDQLYNEFAPNYGDLSKNKPFDNSGDYPWQYKDHSNMKENIEQSPFRMNDPRNKELGFPGRLHKWFYPDEHPNYYPPAHQTNPLKFEGDIWDSYIPLMEMKDEGFIDYFDSVDDIVLDETLGRDFEGAPQDYPHIDDYTTYLNTLEPWQLQGIAGWLDAFRKNAYRRRNFWVQSDV